MIWYTCKKCAPHSIADHSMYGDRACLIQGCSCQKYDLDDKNIIVKTKNIFKDRLRTPFEKRRQQMSNPECKRCGAVLIVWKGLGKDVECPNGCSSDDVKETPHG